MKHARSVESVSDSFQEMRSIVLACICAICLGLVSCDQVVAGWGRSNSPSANRVSIQVGYADNGRLLALHPGQILKVVLPSTLWTFRGSSNQKVLAPLGPERVVHTPFNKSTCPYGGCGTVTARFRAMTQGTAHVSATRTSCGEAMGCTGATARFRFKVVVKDRA